MDSDFWLNDVDTGPAMGRTLLSPGHSSGYCSSEENHTYLNDSAPRNVVHRSESPEPDDVMMHANKRLGGVSGCVIDKSYVQNPSTTLRRVPSKRTLQMLPQPAPDSSDSRSVLKDAMMGLNNHLASELGDSFMVTDNRNVVVGSTSVKRHSSGMTMNGPTLAARSQCGSLPTSVVRPLARTRGGAALASCSTLLRHSATVPNKMHTISTTGQGAIMRCAPPAGLPPNHEHNVKSAVCTISVHEALRDHMYAQKMPATVKPTRRSTTDGCVVPSGMSLLEAFLRSTTSRFDASRNSTELAAEELAKLQVTNPKTPLSVDIKSENGLTSRSSLSPPSLLKQLLMGKVSEAELEQERHRDETRLNAPLPNLPVDSLLTDGFGLDANLQLDDPLSNGIGLLGDGAVMTTVRTSVSCDFDESVQEQSRQEGLWWQHYVAGLL